MMGPGQREKTTDSALVWQSGRVNANGVELSFEQAGDPHGEPLVLVMGLAWQLIHWPANLCEGLARAGFRLLRFDNRDVGLSSSADRGLRFDLPTDVLRKRFGLHVAANYTLHDLAADTVGLMDVLAIPPAHFVGVSMGGMIAQLIAGKQPARVKSLTSIMSSTNHPWLPPPSLPILRAMLTPLPDPPEKELMLARMMRMAGLLAGPDYAQDPVHVRAVCESAYARAFRPSGVLRQTHGVTATGSIEPWTREIIAPSHVVHGLADPMVRPVGGRRSAKLMRASQLTLIPGWGHDLPPVLMPRIVDIVRATAARA